MIFAANPVDSENVKALYRRGQAYKALSNYSSAQQDLELASKLSAGGHAWSFPFAFSALLFGWYSVFDGTIR